MDCRSVRKLLPAYLESDVTSGEKSGIDAHLASCAACSSAADDLRKTVAHVRNLEQVEPPPWMTQKIMARIREEAPAAKKSLFERIFGAWPMKMPVGALATILIAVCTVYVYKAIQPDVTLEVRKEAPSVSAPAQIEKPYAQPPASHQEKKATERLRERPRESAKAARPSATRSGQDAVMPVPAAPAVPARPEADESMARRADRAEEAAVRERFSAKSNDQEFVRAERAFKKAEAPAPAGAAGKEPLFILRAADPAAAIADVRGEIGRAGGLLAEQKGNTLVAELPVERVQDFISRLRAIGAVEDRPYVAEGGKVRLRIRIEPRGTAE
jgi:hypothetical protein